MQDLDLNLLVPLEALLETGSVAGAARKLQLSPSAMSRALTRLRKSTGDPLFVRAGRGLVPTPRALELRARAGPLLDEVRATLRPQSLLDPSRIDRVFTIRAGEGFAETFAPALLHALRAQAPAVRLRFMTKSRAGTDSLRSDEADLETGIAGSVAEPEMRMQRLFEDRFIGVVRAGHPILEAPITLRAYCAQQHVSTWRHGEMKSEMQGPVDRALNEAGAARNVVAMVSGFSAALAIAHQTELVATVPERTTRLLRAGMASFPLPFAEPVVALSLFWHPRFEADPAHCWFRDLFRRVCLQQLERAENTVPKLTFT